MSEQDIKKILNIKGLQSVRHLVHESGNPYAIYITNRFRKIGWLTNIDGKYYGTISKLSLKDKDDAIDYYLAIDENAKKTMNQLCKK